MAVSVPELQAEALKWQRRITYAQSSGLNTAPMTELARTDLSRIAQGGAALPEEEVISQVQAAYTGNVGTPTPQTHPGGADLNPFHLVGHAMSDASNIVRDFVPGLVHEGADIINPHKWEELGQQLGQFKGGSISDMAKEIRALPVVGPLIPGTFALSAGLSGITQHPTMFLLDVFAVASVGAKLATAPIEAAEAGTPLAALQQGHPFQAVARATGIEEIMQSKLKDLISNTEYAHMPVWRAYNGLARLWSNRLVSEGLKKLDEILPKGLSEEERAQAVRDAQDFNPRFTHRATPVSPEVIQAAGPNLLSTLQSQGGDVVAYETVDNPGTIYFNQDEAKASLPEPLQQYGDMVGEVRVDPHDVQQADNGAYTAKDILPNKYYAADHAEMLKNIKDFSEKYDTKQAILKDAGDSVVLTNPVTGETNLFPRDSLPVKAQEAHDQASKDLADQTRKVDGLRAQVKKWEDLAAGRGRAERNRERTAQALADTKTASTVQSLKRVRELYKKEDERLSMLKVLQQETRQKLTDTLRQAPGRKWEPLIENTVKSRLKQQAGLKIFRDPTAQQGAGLAAALTQLHDAYVELASKISAARSREELSGLVGEDTLKRVENETMQDWGQLVHAGYDPIWVRNISPEWYHRKTFANIRPFQTTEVFKSSDKAELFSYQPQVLDISAQLTYAAMEYMRYEATKQYVDTLVHKTGVVHKAAEVEADLQKRYGGDYYLAKAELERNYESFHHPEDPEGEYLIPRAIAKGNRQLLEGDKIPLAGLRHPAHRVFRVAVLTGPRHLVHVTLGGLMMTSLESPGAALEALAHPVALINAMKTGVLPREFAEFQDQFTEALNTGQLAKGMYETHIDQLVAFRGGKKVGQLWNESAVGRGLHKGEAMLNNFENSVTDMYRAATYLHELKNGAENEAALNLVNKTLIDVDNMTPFERTTLRQFFPFWTFTKHILRYVLSYPADHPLRASILAHLAKNMEDTNASGDPIRLSKLFMLGTPDATGKVKTVDFSNLNPFRSMSSMFSMAGFLSGMAPELQVGFRMFGINTLTGAPSLHQNMSYNAYTGTNQADRPSFNPLDFASAFIPQAELLNHYLLLTDTMRSLKKNNPEAYQRSMWQEMNLPFAVAPINIYDVRAKAAAAQYQDAQAAVSQAFKTGNTDALRQYVAVPWQGYLFPGDQVANYIDHYDQLFPGFSPKAVMIKPKLPKKRNIF